jgi:SAM-dependent methyltransferase
VDVRAWLRPVIVAGTERVAAVARRHNWLTDPVQDRPASTDSVAPNEYGLIGFDAMLHALRGIELSRMPRVDGAVLSAGCAGSLYFRWFERCYGPVARHVGVEFYTPEPDDLPDGVDWVKATVADMQGVADSSVELVFSGQNIEHLFGDDAVDFLLESRRVLRPGGWLVIDSPHREIAAALRWTMPEHTIEFTPAEAEELVTLAGFDVAGVRGVWLCREPATGDVQPLWSEDGTPLPADEVARRAVLAGPRPDDSFVWWLEARRVDREPDVAALRARHAEVFSRAWPERQRRLSNAVGQRHHAQGRTVVSAPAGTSGYLIFGPYVPLSPGRYRLTFAVRRRGPVPADVDVAILDVADRVGTVLAERRIGRAELADRQWTDLAVDLNVADLTWGGQFRVYSTGAVALDAIADIRVDDGGAAVVPSMLRRTNG